MVEISNLEIVHLILHSCNLITDDGISELTHCKTLEWIKVIKCRGLTLGAFDNTGFSSTLECLMKYPDFVTGNFLILIILSHLEIKYYRIGNVL